MNTFAVVNDLKYLVLLYSTQTFHSSISPVTAWSVVPPHSFRTARWKSCDPVPLCSLMRSGCEAYSRTNVPRVKTREHTTP